MKTSNPASYDKIFETTANIAISPDHRALLISVEFPGELIITNLDGTDVTIIFDVGGNFVVPIRIKKWQGGGGTSFYIQALR